MHSNMESMETHNTYSVVITYEKTKQNIKQTKLKNKQKKLNC